MLLSLVPIALLVGMLAGAVQLFGSDASYGPNQVVLVIATGVAALVGIHRGLRWPDIQKALVEGIQVGLGPILILLAVGAWDDRFDLEETERFLRTLQPTEVSRVES